LKHPLGKRWFALVLTRDAEDHIKRSRLARDGHILNMAIDAGVVVARFHENYGYDRTETMITFPLWTVEQQHRWFDMLHAHSEWSTALLRNELPEALVAATEAAGIPLIPADDQQLAFICTCYRSNSFCKHQAATWFALTDELLAHPLLIAQLYGVSVQTTIEAILDRPLYAPFVPTGGAPDLGDPARFWNGGELPTVEPYDGAAQTEPVTALGRFPLWHGQFDPTAYLSPIYDIASHLAADMFAGKVNMLASPVEDEQTFDGFADDLETVDIDDPFIIISPPHGGGAIIDESTFQNLQREGISIEMLKRFFRK